MNEKTRKKIVFAALILTVIWGAFNYQWSNKPVDIATTPAQKQVMPKISQGNTFSDSIIEEKIAQNWGNDPFRTISSQTVSKQGGNWVVTGIIYNESSPLAYINRTPLKVGDSIDGAKVIQIEKNYVTLHYNRQNHKIYFFEG